MTVCPRNACRVKPCQDVFESVMTRVQVLAKPCQTVLFALDSVPNRVISSPYLHKPGHIVSKIKGEKSCLTISCPCCFTAVSYQIVAFIIFFRVLPHRAFSFVLFLYRTVPCTKKCAFPCVPVMSGPNTFPRARFLWAFSAKFSVKFLAKFPARFSARLSARSRRSRIFCFSN